MQGRELVGGRSLVVGAGAHLDTGRHGRAGERDGVVVVALAIRAAGQLRARPHAHGRIENRPASDHVRPDLRHTRFGEAVENAGGVRLLGVPHQRSVDELVGHHLRVRDGVDPAGDDLRGSGGEHSSVRPGLQARAVGRGDDGGDPFGVQVGVDLDGRRRGSARLRDGVGQIRVGGDGAHPRQVARLESAGDLPGAFVGEELRTGHQRRVVDVRRRKLADQPGAGQVGDMTQIVGHVAHGRDAAVDLPAQPRLGLRPVRGSGHVLMGVDQTRNDVLTGEIDRAGDVLGVSGQLVRGPDPADALPRDDDGRVVDGGAPGAVEHGGTDVGDHLGVIGRLPGIGGVRHPVLQCCIYRNECCADGTNAGTVCQHAECEA